MKTDKRLTPSVAGRGYTGIGPFTSRINGKKTKAYTKWREMIRRCYSENKQEKNPTYTGCTVVDEWLNFQNFATWFYANNVEGYELDKDILVKDNKIYGPEFCRFIPQEINKAFNDSANSRGSLLLGVRLNGKRYSARTSIFGKRKSLGTFDTELEAYKAYVKAKEIYIKALALKWKDEIPTDIYDVMMSWAVK